MLTCDIRTLGMISMSTDPESRTDFGPYLANVGPIIPGSKKIIRFNHIEDLQEAFEMLGNKVAAFLVEPIQGEAGVIVPNDDYLPRVAEL